MPQFYTIQTNFSAGELTPRMKGRVDVARYQNGADTMQNGIPVVHGGADRRWGLRYLGTTKNSGTTLCRVLPYIFNEVQAYWIELGPLYARFYDSTGANILNAAGTAPLEATHPYIESQLFDITFKQAGDTLFLFHPNVPPQRVRRISATQFVIQPVVWTTVPFAELGHTEPDATLTLSAVTGTGIVFTTASPVVPGAPTIGTATPYAASATVAFTPPAVNGGFPVTSYTATSSPGGITATGTASPITVPGLTNGTAYTFTVFATNSIGNSAASAASNSVTPLASLAPAPPPPTASLTVTATPTDYRHTFGSGTATNILGPTASASTGVAPYTHNWSILTSSGGISITTGNAAQVIFSSTGTNTENTASLRDTVTDSQGTVGHVDVNLDIIMGRPL